MAPFPMWILVLLCVSIHFSSCMQLSLAWALLGPRLTMWQPAEQVAKGIHQLSTSLFLSPIVLKNLDILRNDFRYV